MASENSKDLKNLINCFKKTIVGKLFYKDESSKIKIYLNLINNKIIQVMYCLKNGGPPSKS